MHKVISSYLQKFSTEYELGQYEENDRFERFVNLAIVSSFFPDHFDLEEVTTGPEDQSIDGLAVVLGDELALTKEDAESIFARLKIRQQVAVTYIFIQVKRSEGFDAGDILKFGSGVRRLFDEGQELPSDHRLLEFLGVHEQVVTNLSKVQNGRPDCRLFYVTTGLWHEANGLRPQLKLIEDQLRNTSLFNLVSFEPVDRERLIRYWLQSQTPVQATFPVRSYQPLPDISGVEEAYLAVAPAAEFVDKVLTEDDGRIRSAVFEQNVRAYLGDENPVNSKIKDALLEKVNHDRFAILNNGITIVSSDVKVQSDRISVTDFQIVNGCQTSHVLFRNRTAVSERVFLPLKVIEADDPGIVSQVVEATNSQSDVEEAQFLSIRPFVRKIQEYFDAFDNEADRERRVYFERRTRQYAGQDIGKARIFDIARLARVFAAMFLDFPHLAARYPTQMFQEALPQLFQGDQREHAYYAAALSLYRLELSLGNQYVPRPYQRYKWHLLMILKYQVGGLEAPPLNSKKLDAYCDRIVNALTAGGKASAAPFLEAVKIVDAVGMAGPDRLKRQAFTDEIKRKLGVK